MRNNKFCNKLIILLLVFYAQIILAQPADREPASRIVALSPHSVEMLFSIGAGDRIVGTVSYADYPEAAKSIPRIGSYHGIQIENLLALKPDLVIGWKNGNKASDLSKLESLGLNMVYSQPKMIPDILKELVELGKLTGTEEKARERLINKYRARQPVSVFYQVWHDPLQSVGKDSWVESLIRDCGGKNIFSQSKAPYPHVSIESVLVKNPKVIIIPGHSGDQDKFPEKRAIWSKWSEIAAVKTDRIFPMNGDLLHRFTPRALDGLELLCQKIDEGRVRHKLEANN